VKGKREECCGVQKILKIDPGTGKRRYPTEAYMPVPW